LVKFSSITTCANCGTGRGVLTIDQSPEGCDRSTDLMVAIRMHVVGIEGRPAVDLPSDACGGVHRVCLDEVIRNHCANLTRSAAGEVAVEAAAPEHRGNVGVIPQESRDP
jgi:hypothetical protein